MPTIRERISRFIGGSELREKEERTQQMLETLMESQFHIRRDPASLLRNLQEVDSQLIDLILEQRGWQRIGGLPGGGFQLSNQDRLDRVSTARYMSYWDTQSKLAVNTWTDFGFGQKVIVTPVDETANEIWTEFWSSKRNQPVLGERVLHEQSDEVVKAGELFYSFWVETASGLEPAKTTVRTVRTEEIDEIVTMPDDPMRSIWYIHNVKGVQVGGKLYGKIAYRDWQATDDEVENVPLPTGAIDASELRPETKVVMLYAARNRFLVNGTQLRGFPEFSQAYEWFRAYKDALGDVMAKNRAVAMFVDKIKVQSGSRAIDSIQASLTSSLTSSTNKLETNPNPVPGSTWIENQMMDRSRMSLGTGASDDQKSTMIVLGQGSAGTQIPLGWMGRPDSFQNKSVADIALIPFNEAMQRYQTWWSSVFRDMARIVLSAAGIEDEESLKVDVTLETLQTIDVAELVAVISAAVSAGEKYIIEPKVASSIVLAALQSALGQVGVVDPADVITAEESNVEKALAIVRENLRSGSISHEVAAEWALCELAELVKDD